MDVPLEVLRPETYRMSRFKMLRIAASLLLSHMLFNRRAMEHSSPSRGVRFPPRLHRLISSPCASDHQVNTLFRKSHNAIFSVIIYSSTNFCPDFTLFFTFHFSRGRGGYFIQRKSTVILTLRYPISPDTLHNNIGSSWYRADFRRTRATHVSTITQNNKPVLVCLLNQTNFLDS